MTKEIYVNVGERETRIAVVEEGKLVELQIERAERVVGSLYKCRVVNVLPGMDAAFADLGLERNAFLYVGDVLPMATEESAGDTNAVREEERSGGNGHRRTRHGRGRQREILESAMPSRVPEEGAEETVENEEAFAEEATAAEEEDTEDLAEGETLDLDEDSDAAEEEDEEGGPEAEE